MAVVTKIVERKRTPNRRSVFLDGAFAFGCNLNVVAKFRLREGMELSPPEVQQIEQGEVQQECFDAAIRLLENRLHSRAELKRKLMRKEWGEVVIEAALENLQRLGYIDDARFAKAKAQSAAEYKHHGRRRAFLELMRSGVKGEIANKALDEIYAGSDPIGVARELAEKQAARLKKLDPMTARRRLVGMLQRRGFDYDAIKPVVDQVLGRGVDE
jgi:regulatory protein